MVQPPVPYFVKQHQRYKYVCGQTGKRQVQYHRYSSRKQPCASVTRERSINLSPARPTSYPQDVLHWKIYGTFQLKTVDHTSVRIKYFYWVTQVSETLRMYFLPIWLSTQKKRMGQDSVVGIESRYGVYGPGIESQWERDYPHPSNPALGPIQPPIQWVPGLSRGQNGRGVALTIHPI